MLGFSALDAAPLDASGVTIYSLNLGPATYAITGSNGTLLANYQLQSLGAYSIAGNDPRLVKTTNVSFDPTTYTISGQAATLYRDRPLNAALGTFTYIGSPFTVQLAAVGVSGSYPILGQDGWLLHTALANELPSSYAAGGATALLKKDYVLSSNAGTYAEAGSGALLGEGYELWTLIGPLTITGYDTS